VKKERETNTSKDIVGVLAVLLVTLIDLIIIVSFDAVVIKDVSAVVVSSFPRNLYWFAI
jgi:hypothetical protein